jgi:hypothetical protein
VPALNVTDVEIAEGLLRLRKALAKFKAADDEP